MTIFAVDGLPQAPLAAAAQFHAQHVPVIEAAAVTSGSCLTLAFPAADHTHRGWRLAAVQLLARAVAPQRVNAVSGGSPAAVDAAAEYFQRAPGLTGQLISLDDSGAGAVLPLSS